MGDTHRELTPTLQDFVAAQPLFFVATAPLARDGHVNLSPKGLDTFRVLSPLQVAYLDLTGSGNETSAHLAENGRITFMFCSFSRSPQILRLYGRGTTILPDDARWSELASGFPAHEGARQIILVDLDRIQTSCGWGVPAMEEARQRDTLPKWHRSKGPDGLVEYRRQKNATSIDGLASPLGEALGSAESDGS